MLQGDFGRENMLQAMREAIDSMLSNRAAAIRYGTDVNPASLYRVTIPLDVAQSIDKPFKIPAPFTAVQVEDISDSLTSVNLAITSDTKFQLNNYKTLKQNDFIEFSRAIASAFLFWEAQAGKSITLLFGIDVAIRPGSLVSVVAGGVSITDGDAVTTLPAGAVTTTAAVLFAGNPTRKKMTIQNLGTDDLFLGGANVTDALGANPGILVGPGQSFAYNGQGEMYAVAEAASPGIVVGLTEMS